MNKKILFLTKAAVIAALYAVLTLIGAVMNLSYGGIQFRFSEALCVLPLFTSAAVPGLFIGCIAANVISTVSPFDMLFGSLATLFSALASKRLGGIKIKGYPFCSMLTPVIFNGLMIGAQIAFFTSRSTFFTAFAVNAASVALSEAAVMFTLGSAVYFGIKKNGALNKLIADR